MVQNLKSWKMKTASLSNFKALV